MIDQCHVLVDSDEEKREACDTCEREQKIDNAINFINDMNKPDSDDSLVDSISHNSAETNYRTRTGNSTAHRRKSSIRIAIESRVGPLDSLMYIFRHPMFYVICAMFVTYNIVLQIYLMTIVDVAIFNNVAAKNDAILLIVVFSVADLLGRISFGWISDKGAWFAERTSTNPLTELEHLH